MRREESGELRTEKRRPRESHLPGPIDDALKHLTELSPQDWLVRGGWPAAAAALIDADLGTISGAADKAIRVSSTPTWLLAIDFQAGHDSLAKLPDLLLHDRALFKRHGLLVRTLLILLHRSADSRRVTGLYELSWHGGGYPVRHCASQSATFGGLVFWRQVSYSPGSCGAAASQSATPPHRPRDGTTPPRGAKLLSGGLGQVPLAPLGRVQQAKLPAVVAQMKRRFDCKAPSQPKNFGPRLTS